MAEDSAELIRTLEENRRTLQKQIGCLAGLLQIFDRHRCLTGRRFGSHRTNTTTHEDAASTAYGTDVTFHDPGSPFPTYHKFSEVSIQSSRGNDAATEERVVLSTNKEELVRSRVSSDFVSRASENIEPRKSPPRTVPVVHRRATVDGTTRLSFDNFCRSPDSALIRTLVVNSLHKEKPRSSVDNSNREVMAGLIRLKNLARSRSVGGRNAYCSDNSKFPRSSSLSAHQSSGIYSEAPNLTHLQTRRLTVELEEGPGVGTKKLQKVNSSNWNDAKQAVMNLDKALGEVDLKESFRALQREKSTRRSEVECHVDERSAQDNRRNVVARLMGLEEFSSPPTQRKDHCMKARGRSLSPKHRLMDGMPSPLRQREVHCKLTKTMKLQEGTGCKRPSPTLEPLHGDIIERLRQLRSRNSVEDRDTLNQIMEALQLKGLLHSPQRKSRSATPGYDRQRSKDPVASEPASFKMKHEETDIHVKAPIQRDHHVECKLSSRSECSERSDATTGTRCSNEYGGSAKPGRGRSRSPVRASKSPVRSASKSPVRASKSPVRLNNDARSTSQVTTKLHSNSSPISSCNKPHLKPGQVTIAPHLRDKRESKVAMVTGKGTTLSLDPVSNAKPDGAIRNCDSAQTVKSSPEMRRQKRITSREIQSGASILSSLGQEHEEKSSETIADSEKPSEEENSVQTSTNQDSCVDLNATPAKIREILETLKDRQMPLKDAKEASEIMTPRAGFQVEKISPALEKSGQCSEGSCEQRSPVSVLDNSIFDEDGSPSPIPTDSYESNDQCDEVRPENAVTSDETESDHTSSCDNAREFVEELLMRSGIANHVNLACSSRVKHFEINPTCLLDLKKDLQRTPLLEPGEHLSTLHPQALMDYVYELLALKVAEYESTPWNGAFKRHNLVDAIWKELQDFPSAASGDICDTVQGILIQDVGSRGPEWTNFGAEIGEVGVEVEKMIYRDLMEEVLNDLTCSGSSRYLAKLLEGPRRQLFAS